MASYDYELVAARDWPKHPEDVDPYSLETLDMTWYPMISGQLKDRQTNGLYSVDSHSLDVTDSSDRRYQTQFADVIDGRGRFDAKDLEKELKSMPRRDLVTIDIFYSPNWVRYDVTFIPLHCSRVFCKKMIARFFIRTWIKLRKLCARFQT